MIFLQCEDKGPAAASCIADNTNLEVVGIDPLGHCINWKSEGTTVGMIQEKWDDFFFHEEQVLSLRMSPGPGSDLRLEVASLRNHGEVRQSRLAATH